MRAINMNFYIHGRETQLAWIPHVLKYKHNIFTCFRLLISLDSMAINLHMRATTLLKTYHMNNLSCYLHTYSLVVPNMDSKHFCTHKHKNNNMHFLNSHGFNNTFTHLEFHIFFLHNFLFSHGYTLHIHIHMSLTHLHMVTYTFHITLYTFLGAVTHSPNHQRRTYTHHITHRRHLGIPMATLGLRRPGEQVSTLTSGTCPPPGFPPNALRVTYTLNFLRGTFP